ncbi:MAG TPA: GtrA family protein [Kofleriaceae bacterium]|jgi:putative flippase GtrA
MSRQPPQVVAAGIGGIIGSVFDVATLVILVHAGTRIPVAAFAGAAAGAVVNFVLNKYLAFRDHTPLALPQVARFALVALATALLMAGAMELVAVRMHVPYLLAKAICAAIIFAIWTYPAQRRVFRRAPAY